MSELDELKEKIDSLEKVLKMLIPWLHLEIGEKGVIALLEKIDNKNA